MFKFLIGINKPKKLPSYLGRPGVWDIEHHKFRNYQIVEISNTEQFNPIITANSKSDLMIPELSQWCEDNDCSYGWMYATWNDSLNRWKTDHSLITSVRLFIISKNVETVPLIKLTWCC